MNGHVNWRPFPHARTREVGCVGQRYLRLRGCCRRPVPFSITVPMHREADGRARTSTGGDIRFESAPLAPTNHCSPISFSTSWVCTVSFTRATKILIRRLIRMRLGNFGVYTIENELKALRALGKARRAASLEAFTRKLGACSKPTSSPSKLLPSSMSRCDAGTVGGIGSSVRRA
jgi:hypothetical protein